MSWPETSTVEEVDRISTLPDDILIQILSSLPTKQAFLTSLLSKRWKNLWCYVPDLEFVETKSEVKDSRFDVFVYHVLRSRVAAGNHSIQTFIMDPKYYSSTLQTLVVGEVDDEEEGTKLPTATGLPYTILTCTTLVVLKLKFLDLGAGFWIKLPSLKTLHLKHISFEQAENLDNLLEECPILEDLLLFDVFTEMDSYLQSWLNLPKLNRADIAECHFPLDILSNVEFLRIKLSRVYQDCRLFPTFNLTHLVLCYNWDIVPRVLHHCPKLHNLELFYKLGDSYCADEYFGQYEREYWAHPKSVPGCLSSNLTTCTMRDFAFGGLQNYHIMLAKFILKNSRFLETMSIWCSRKRSKIERRLTSCSRASATCQLSVYREHI